jgi:PAS domain S-box-containing protein
MRAEQEPLRDLDMWFIDSLAVPASLHDVEGRFVHMNPAAERASGFSKTWWRGRHFTDALLPEVREHVAEHFRRAVERGEPTEFETVFTDASERVRGVRAQHLPLRSGDTTVGVLILAYEVSASPSEPTGTESPPSLTPRQREILDLIASGASTSEIAEKLTLSTETVRNHVRSLLSELQVHTRLEAIVAARRLGLLAPPPLKPPPPDPPSPGSR